ncbi:FliA/WhiG family RNA polymerase sigma factor [Pallidibacillus pasinlerensis]|nr:FliA/WhiG family RNA polymerase sigma factor [Pallidibacillus pasinlerensis]
MPYTVQPKHQDEKMINTSDENNLYYQWINERDDHAGNKLVEKYTPLVHIIAEKIFKTLPKSITKDELISLGFIGLYEALEKYDPSRELKFETYASFRIRGSIIDGLRKEDWLPRKTREKTKKLEKVIQKLEQKYLRKVTPEEIAEEANMPLDEVNALIDESYFSNILSIDDHIPQNGEDNDQQSFILQDDKMKTPEETILFSERIQELSEAIKQLTEKEQIVLSLFYQEELTLTEIGQVLDLSTSRISQIHSKTIKKLRKYLQD